MSKQVTIKLDDRLMESLNDWMEQNQETNRSQIIIKALKKYISSEQVLKPVQVSEATFGDLDEHFDDLMLKHKEAMDRLK